MEQIVALDVGLIRKPEVRFIKLGPNNSWASRALRNQEVPFSFKEVPHELALSGDEKKIAEHMTASGRVGGPATSAARQILSFYGLDEDAIFITFADGMMWWTTAGREVVWLGDSADYAPRIRRAAGWSAYSRANVPFYMSSLSSRLTKLASTQQTLCQVEASDYVLRKISDISEPSVVHAVAARTAVTTSILEMIGNLHWTDFETLVDLLLARSGWNRITSLGGQLKDVDMIVEQTITGERAFVQVKSASNQKELDSYVDLFSKNAECTRLIYVCHSPSQTLATARSDVQLWVGDDLANMVFKQGYFDWLVSHVS